MISEIAGIFLDCPIPMHIMLQLLPMSESIQSFFQS